MKPKIIEGQKMQSMSECIVRFGNCGKSFTSPAMYRSTPTKRVKTSSSVFRVSSHLRNVYTDPVNILRLPLWVH